MKIGIQKTVEVEAKTIQLYIKVRDQFEASLHDQDGAEIGEYEGYVPQFFPGEHYGDYCILNIDIETGHIVNWQAPTPQQLVETFVQHKD